MRDLVLEDANSMMNLNFYYDDFYLRGWVRWVGVSLTMGRLGEPEIHEMFILMKEVLDECK